MNFEWNKIKEKFFRGQKPDKEQFFIMILCGVLLLVIALPTGDKEKKSRDSVQETEPMSNWMAPFQSEEQEKKKESKDAQEDTLENYTKKLERKVAEVLSQMDQAGTVEVMITMESSVEKVVEKDAPVSRNHVSEQGDGSSRETNSVEAGAETVYETGSGNTSTPYVVKTIQPRVEGVMVVAEGAGQGNVSKNITEAIQVLFGIEPHKIKVVKMKTN